MSTAQSTTSSSDDPQATAGAAAADPNQGTSTEQDAGKEPAEVTPHTSVAELFGGPLKRAADFLTGGAPRTPVNDLFPTAPPEAPPQWGATAAAAPAGSSTRSGSSKTGSIGEMTTGGSVGGPGWMVSGDEREVSDLEEGLAEVMSMEEEAQAAAAAGEGDEEAAVLQASTPTTGNEPDAQVLMPQQEQQTVGELQQVGERPGAEEQCIGQAAAAGAVGGEVKEAQTAATAASVSSSGEGPLQGRPSISMEVR